MALNHPKAGPNSIPPYQLSGVPYVTASAGNEVDVTPIRHDFPFVTRFFQVKNTDADHAMRVGFSANGVSATETKNYFLLAAGAQTDILELRTKTLFFRANAGSAQASFEIVAGLTTIESSEFPILSGTIGTVTNAFEGVG
jgi:hypothetical protein